MRRFLSIALTLALLTACATATPPITPTLNRAEGTATTHAINVATMDAVGTRQAATAAAVGPTATRVPPPTALPTPTLQGGRPVYSPGIAPEWALARLGIGWISGMALSPDGSLMAVGTTTGVYVYATQNGAQVWAAAVHYASRPVWSPDGARIAVRVMNEPGIVLVLRGSTGSTVARFEHTAMVESLAWATDSQRLAIGWGNSEYDGQPVTARVTVWDTFSGERIATLEPPATDRFTILSGAYAITWAAHDTRIMAAAYGEQRDSSTGSHSRSIFLVWDTASGALINTNLQDFTAYDPVQFRAHADAVLVFSGLAEGDAGPFGDHRVLVLNPKTGELVTMFQANPGDDPYSSTGIVTDAQWSPDGQWIATAATGGTVIVWDATTYRHVRRLDTESAGAPSGFPSSVHLAWSPDSTQLLEGTTVDEGGRVTLWDVKTGDVTQQIDHVSSGNPRSLGWLRDGSGFAAASEDSANVFDARTGQRQASIETPDVSYDMDRLSWSPNGRLIGWSSTDESTRSILLASAAADGPIMVVPNTMHGISWSLDGRAVVTIDSYGQFIIDPATGALLAAVSDIAFAPGPPPDPYNMIAVDNSGTGEPLQSTLSITGRVTLKGPPAAINAKAWSPDGSFFAAGGGRPIELWTPIKSGTAENAIYVWRTDTWQQVFTLTGHTGRVTALAFSPDGRLLASGSADGTVIIWNIAP